MDNHRLTEQVFIWYIRKDRNGIKNHVFVFSLFMHIIGMSHICELESVYTKLIFIEMEQILYQYFADKWHAKLSKIEGFSGKGLNKHRTYRKF